MNLKSRLSALESQDRSIRSPVIFVSIGDELQSANVQGVGCIKPTTSESDEDFAQRVYATRAAGVSLDRLTEPEKCRAFRLGAVRREVSTTKTVTIGGECHDAF